MIANYFSKKCSACFKVEREVSVDLNMNGRINSFTIISILNMFYKLNKYHVREERHLSEVKSWRQWSKGLVPAIEVRGFDGLERYIGVEGLSKLADRCVNWIEDESMNRRLVTPSNINVKKEVL